MASVAASAENDLTLNKHDDYPWLVPILGAEPDSNWLCGASELVKVGNSDVSGTVDPDEVRRVAGVRQFLLGEMMGMASPDSDYLKTYERIFHNGNTKSNSGIRLGHFVEVNRTLARHGLVELIKIADHNTYSSNGLLEPSIEAIEAQGASVLLTARRFIQALRMGRKRITERADFLGLLVQNVGGVLETEARVLSRDETDYAATAKTVNARRHEMGIDSKDEFLEFFQLAPILFCYTVERVDALTRLMAEHGNSSQWSAKGRANLARIAVMRHVICIADGEKYTPHEVRRTYGTHKANAASVRYEEIVGDEKFLVSLLGRATADAVLLAEERTQANSSCRSALPRRALSAVS